MSVASLSDISFGVVKLDVLCTIPVVSMYWLIVIPSLEGKSNESSSGVFAKTPKSELSP